MNNKTVLILSDRSDSTPAWVEAFQQRGLKVASTSSPIDVTRIWREAAPMVTVVDLSLSFADCLHLCRDLRGIAAAPILLVLPSANGGDLLEAYRAGATECLIQPASPAVILLKALAWSMRSEWTRIDHTDDLMAASPRTWNTFSSAVL